MSDTHPVSDKGDAADSTAEPQVDVAVCGICAVCERDLWWCGLPPALDGDVWICGECDAARNFEALEGM